jgi:hypothetical protein
MSEYNLKLDLNKTGLDMFFKPYQRISLQVLWEHPEGLNTREVWKATNYRMERTISRASIINFLAMATENGILNYKEITGKGGHRRIYWHKYDESELSNYLKDAVLKSLDTLLI